MWALPEIVVLMLIIWKVWVKNMIDIFKTAVDLQISETVVPYGCCEMFSRATFTLSIHRNPLYYIIRVVMPCSLLSFLAVLTYLLQPNRTERLAIGQNAFSYLHVCGRWRHRVNRACKFIAVISTRWTLRSVGRGFKIQIVLEATLTTLGKLFSPMCLCHQAV